MPNWVTNTAILDFTNAKAATKERLSLVVASAVPKVWPPDEDAPTEAEVGLLSTFLPMPADVSEAPYHPKQHEWALENWGTKWDVKDYSVKTTEDGKVRLHFSTANSEPAGLYQTLADEGVIVSAFAVEPGCGEAVAYVHTGDELQVEVFDEIVQGDRTRFDPYPELRDLMEIYWDISDNDEENEDGEGGEVL